MPNLLPSGTAGLCTRQQVKSRVRIKGAGSDELIDLLIDAVTRVAAKRYHREFMPHVTETRTFRVYSNVVRWLGNDLRGATSVVLHPNSAKPVTLVDGRDYMPDEDQHTGTSVGIRISESVCLCGAMMDNFGFTEVAVTGEWGIWDSSAEVPADVQEAAVETVLAWMDRSVQTVAGDGGGGDFAQMPVIPSTWDIPASAHRKFQHYARTI